MKKDGSAVLSDNRIKNLLFLLSLMVIGMAAFLLIGSDSYVLFDDSGSYINMESYMEGVMPVYPLFLRMNKILFGEAVYLQVVIVEQAVFACICLIVFVRVVQSRFQLSYWETYCIYLLSFLPFTTDMPDAMATQEILTEGIAYAAFYLFMALLLQAAWTKQIRYIVYVFLMTLFLAATRSQLQILFGVCGVILFYLVLTGTKKGTGMSLAVRLILGTAGCVCIGLAGIWCTGRISTIYQERLRQYTRDLQREESIAKLAEEAGDGADLEAITAEYDAKERPITETEWKASSAQYASLLFARGMYEADYEDYLLFEDEQMQKLYLYLYQTADENGCLYTYAKPGLWMWKDIVGGIGSVGNKCLYAMAEYYNAMPEISQRDDYHMIRSNSANIIGLTLLKAHWPRFLYHTLMMLPQAFICTVFFQIARIYLLCHLVTLFLYVSAIGLMIWAYADRKVDRAYGEFMSAVLGTNLVMILIISLVFFGQQRYLVYNFGIFYMVYFLLLIQIWKIYGKNWLMKWKDRKKS